MHKDRGRVVATETRGHYSRAFIHATDLLRSLRPRRNVTVGDSARLTSQFALAGAAVDHLGIRACAACERTSSARTTASCCDLARIIGMTHGSFVLHRPLSFAR